MDSTNDRSIKDKFIFKCKECGSLMTFEMTFFFDPDIDVYCPCTSIMEYIGA